MAIWSTGIDLPVDARFVFAATVGFLLLRPSVMKSLLGYAKTTYYSSNTSLPLKTKDNRAITFVELCKSSLPICRLNPFLFNGHLQTIWAGISKSSCPIYYKRWTFENEDPTYTGTFSVDFVVQPYEGRGDSMPPRTSYFTEPEFEVIGSNDSKPMLVVLHGLSGGSHELYLRETLAPLVDEKGGWEACVIISRGCSGTKITTNILYNARATWDIRQTVKWLRKKFPNRPLFGCGFSLGANIITNYIGEEGADCEFKAAVVLSSPWNLDLSSACLQRTWAGMNIYSKAMGSSLRKLFERHVDQVSKNPKIDVEAVRKVKYLHEFDRTVQGPTWGYPTEGAYYRDASSTDALLGVRIPLLAINAEDDPIASSEALPYQEVQQTPYGVLCCTTTGGHLAWYELGGGRWFARAATLFLQQFYDQIDLGKIPDSIGAETDGKIIRPQRDPLKPVFQPTRRKLDMPA